MPRLIESLPALPFEARKDVSQVSVGCGSGAGAVYSWGGRVALYVQRHLANKVVQHLLDQYNTALQSEYGNTFWAITSPPCKYSRATPFWTIYIRARRRGDI